MKYRERQVTFLVATISWFTRWSFLGEDSTGTLGSSMSENVYNKTLH